MDWFKVFFFFKICAGHNNKENDWLTVLFSIIVITPLVSGRSDNSLVTWI